MAIREMIGNLEPGEDVKTAPLTASVIQAAAAPKERGPQISSKDLNRIKELLDKFPSVEDALSKISK